MTSRSVNICLVAPPGRRFIANAMLDVAELLQLAVASLGYAPEIVWNDLSQPGINLVLNDHLAEDPALFAGRRYVIYQLEQLHRQQQDWLQLHDQRVRVLKGAMAVWEFSPRNLPVLDAAGVAHARHVPIGFHPALERIAPADPDIDVLFYGSINKRRKVVLDELAAHCRVKAVFGVYGERRDALIARSKIVLNLRNFPETSIMEQPRIAYLLNNRRFVVSEDADDNPYGDAIVAVPYEALTKACFAYLEDEAGRARMAERGYQFLAERPMTALIEEPLQALQSA